MLRYTNGFAHGALASALGFGLYLHGTYLFALVIKTWGDWVRNLLF
jgi:hypothetical protein